MAYYIEHLISNNGAYGLDPSLNALAWRSRTLKTWADLCAPNVEFLGGYNTWTSGSSNLWTTLALKNEAQAQGTSSVTPTYIQFQSNTYDYTVGAGTLSGSTTNGNPQINNSGRWATDQDNRWTYSGWDTGAYDIQVWYSDTPGHRYRFERRVNGRIKGFFEIANLNPDIPESAGAGWAFIFGGTSSYLYGPFAQYGYSNHLYGWSNTASTHQPAVGGWSRPDFPGNTNFPVYNYNSAFFGTTGDTLIHCSGFPNDALYETNDGRVYQIIHSGWGARIQ